MQDDRRSFRSLPVGEVDLTIEQLKKFYSCTYLEELVLIQNNSIERLQHRLRDAEFTTRLIR